MKKIYTILFAAILTGTATNLKAQVNAGDSLALVDLYNSTNGPGWSHHTNWLTANPVSTWVGVKVKNNRVYTLILGNNRLSGTIPSTIGNCTALNDLELQANQLTGSIPSSIGNLINLHSMSLYYNQLTGSLPSTIGNLTSIQELWLFNNKLSGNIPSSITNLTTLINLAFDDNQLTGSIPFSIGNMAHLSILRLGMNQLTGTIPSSIGNLAHLGVFDLTRNQITGNIPSTVGNLTNLVGVYFSHNQLTGSIPLFSSRISSSCAFYFNNNDLTGRIPNPPHTIDNLVTLDSNRYNFNAFESVIAKYTQLTYAPQKNLYLHKNGNLLSVYAGGTLSNNTYKWYKNNVLVNSATGDSTLTLSGAGTYNAVVTNSIVTLLTLYSDTLTITSPITTANNLSIINQQPSTFLSPNPAKDFINITLGREDNAIIKIYDATGKMVKRLSIIGQSTVINIAGFAAGIYYVEINREGVITKQQFVKQ